MLGRVWPRHGHRGRPLNSVVIRHEGSVVIGFVKSHIAVLRAVVLCSVLAYLALTFAWLNLSWRSHASHQLGSMFFLGSLPWSLPWAAFEPELRWLVPAPFAFVLTALIVGVGFGLNVAIVGTLAGYTAKRLGAPIAAEGRAHDV